MVLDEGEVLDGKYVIVRALATGSMGEVYLGRNERIGKEVAVKVLRRDCADDRAIVNRFEEEARIATAVRSSHVVDVYDLGELPTGERYIVMEYVDGESLGMRMAREGKLSARAIGAITLQILDGLIAAHAAGVTHRDLKPDNVILTRRDGQEIVKLVDFGVSKRAEPGAPRDVKRATLDGTLLGTPIFMSPEQARGEPDGVDHRTDIFSLGVSMYEALSGEVPFDADNVVALLSRIMNDAEVPLEKRVPDIDPGLARIVRKAMAKDPDDRYQSAAQMREALADWYTLFGSTSAVRSSLEGVTRTYSIPPFAVTVDRKRARATLAAAALAAVLTAWLTHHPAPTAQASAPVETPASAPPPSPPIASAPTPIVVPPTCEARAEIRPPPPPTPSFSAPPRAIARTPRAKPVAPKVDEAPAAAIRDAGAGAPLKLEAKIDDVAPSPSASDTPPPDPPATP